MYSMNSHCPSDPGPVDTDMQLIECCFSFGIAQRMNRSVPASDPVPTCTHTAQTLIACMNSSPVFRTLIHTQLMLTSMHESETVKFGLNVVYAAYI
jgi:hypothetical protein